MLQTTMQRIIKPLMLLVGLALTACQDAKQKTENSQTVESNSVGTSEDSSLENSISNKVSLSPEPAWVEKSDLMPVPDDATGLMFLRRNDLLAHLDGNGQSTYRSQRMKLLDSRALQIGNLALSWNPASGAPMVHTLLIHRDNEVINVLDNNKFEVIRREDQLEQAMINGILTATLRVPDLRVGDELEWAFTVPSHDPTLGSISYGLIPVGAALQAGQHVIGVSWENGQRPNIQLTDDLIGLERRTERSLFVSLTNPEILSPPKDAPPRYSWQRVIEYSDFTSWQGVSKKFNDLFDQASMLSPKSGVKQEAKKIAETHLKDLDRAKAALELVQQQVRYIYVGLDGGNYKPATADETWRRRYGDCKGKSSLLLAILRELNIEAELILVSNSGADDGFFERLPSPSLFDHVLLRAEIDGKKYWLDPTLPVVVEPSLDPIIPYRWTLPLSTDGSTLSPVPQNEYALPQEIGLTEYDARNGFAEPARKVSTSINRGVTGLSQYMRYSAVTSEQLKAELSNAFSGGSEWDSIESVTYRYDRDTQASILTITGTGPIDWDELANGRFKLTLPGGGFRPPSRRQRAPGEGKSVPFYKARDYDCHVTTVRLPQDTELENWGFNTTFQEEIFGRWYYRMMERRDDRTIRMIRASRIEDTEISPERAQRDNGRIDGFDNSKAVIEYNPNKIMKPWGNLRSVPATYEIDWTRPLVPCLPYGMQSESQSVGSRKSIEYDAGLGDAEAQYKMGTILYQDTVDDALNWFEKAAAQGHKNANLELGRYYGSVGKEPKRAVEFLRQSEDDKDGAFMLADIFFRNPNLFPDVSDARVMELYHISSKNDNRYAQRALAQRYKDGSMIKRDEVEALKWAFISNGFDSHLNNSFNKDLSKDEIETALRRAEEWINKFRKDN